MSRQDRSGDDPDRHEGEPDRNDPERELVQELQRRKTPRPARDPLRLERPLVEEIEKGDQPGQDERRVAREDDKSGEPEPDAPKRGRKARRLLRKMGGGREGDEDERDDEGPQDPRPRAPLDDKVDEHEGPGEKERGLEEACRRERPRPDIPRNDRERVDGEPRQGGVERRAADLLAGNEDGPEDQAHGERVGGQSRVEKVEIH